MLIEVALPLDEINAESSRDKSIRYDYPSTLLEEPKIYTVPFRTDHSRRFGGGTRGRREVAPAFCSVSLEAVDCEDHV